MRFFRSVRALAAVSVAAALVMALTIASVVASVDNKGTEFLMGYLPNYQSNAANLQVHLTGDTATTVTLEYPVGTVVGTYAVTPGTVTVASVPVAANQWAANAVASRIVRASAPDEFVAYMANIQGLTSDAALALPVDTMNTEYILADYNGLGSSFQPHFVVYAAYDNTTVTITPTAALAGGHAAGTPFNVVLNAGEGYFNQGSGSSVTLTGSRISADRPVGVTNGGQCLNIPTGYGACDHVFEVAQPVQSWGLTIGVAGLPLRDTSFYRILASENGTDVNLDGAPLASLNAGQFHEVALGGDHVFDADKPIYVVQYMPGQGYPGSYGTGDPAMGNMIPFAQYLPAYTFSTVGGGQFARNFVSIIAANADVGSLTLDGLAVPAASFSPIGTSGYSAARIELTEGTHSTASASPHGITVEGYNNYDSYIYPGGALFKFINPVGDANAPIVTLAPPAGDPPAVSGIAEDNRPSEDANNDGILDPGEDLNSNGLIDEDTGIYFVELGPGADNLVLTVAPFIPGDGTVNFVVSLADPGLPGSGTVVVTDGAGNETEVPVVIEVITNEAPTVAADEAVTTTPEGTDASNTGTVADPDGDPVTLSASAGTVTNNGDGTWSWTGPALDGPGGYTVAIDADDGNGGTATTTFDVVITNVAPSVDAGANVTVLKNELVTLQGTFIDPAGTVDEAYLWSWTITGDAGSASYGGTLPTSASFATSGTYSLVLSVTDKDGGVGSDTVGVTVVNQAPSCTDAVASISEIWPANHKMVDVSVLGVTDADGDTISIVVDSIFQDEPTNTTGDGNTEVDGQIDGSIAWVRAERSGTKKVPGDGRAYHIGFTASDGEDSCSGTVSVRVPHDQGKKSVFVDGGALYDATAS
jgi:hypothetical protein